MKGKCIAATRLAEENEQLKEELRQICHENEMLWRYRMGDGTSDARRHKAEMEELEELKARLDAVVDMLNLLTKILKVLVKMEEKNG